MGFSLKISGWSCRKNKPSGVSYLKRSLALCSLFWVALLFSCDASRPKAEALQVPRGFLSVLEINADGQIFRVGPFVGYYFRPQSPENLTRLEFVCFNEKSFYTLDLAENALLFEGEARLARLPDTGDAIPRPDDRMVPIFFPEVPAPWLATRPRPVDEFVHFHSGYNAAGPVRYGYWLRHVGVAQFTYDMGGRVTQESPLYHKVKKGTDKNFPKIVEFDAGPG